jgi:hypothetical protein
MLHTLASLLTCMSRKLWSFVMAALLAAHTAQPARAQAAVDWTAAEAVFEANRASGDSPPRAKGAAKCAGYWMMHGAAVVRGEFPQAALDALDPELISREEAGLNALVLSRLFSNLRDYEKAKEEAQALIPRVLDGERDAIRDYFGQLGRCSFGP